MDSRLLKAFHDDLFDGNTVKYDNGNDFWTHHCDTMGLQLTETLNGILPIAATDVNDFFSEQQPIPDAMMDFDYVTTNLNHTENGSAVSIVNAFNDHSENSNSSFRSRTESSSIADYESHSSDYDDDKQERNHELSGCLAINETGIDSDIGNLENYNSKRANSINTNASDIDNLAMQIDPMSFDLAEFITKDDCNTEIQLLCNDSNETESANHRHGYSKTIVSESDTESDIIVDVETVDNDEDGEYLCEQTLEKDRIEEIQTEDLAYVDDVNGDPSWCPTSCKKQDPHGKYTSKVNTKSKDRCLPALKKHCDSGRARCWTEKCRAKQSSNKINHILNASNSGNSKVRSKAFYNSSGAALSIPRKGIEQSDKNLNMDSRGTLSSNTPKLNKSEVPQEGQAEMEKATAKEVHKVEQKNTPVVKRKLNLEEYKRRRAQNIPGEISGVESERCHSERNVIDETNGHKRVVAVVAPIQQTKEVAAVIKSLREPPATKAPVDPITEAKNKVLRLQQLKKAQQLKIIDSTISAKVPRVTKLLPLKEIVKDTYCAEAIDDEDHNQCTKKGPEYEEIIIVSVGCNTDISMPPKPIINVNSRSLLKSSALLFDISNSVKQGQTNERIRISQNSLICSIQDAVVRKTAMTAVKSQANMKSKGMEKEYCSRRSKKESEEHNFEHGEDKIIMHLRMDRIRKPTTNICIQTDSIPEFLSLAPTTTIEGERGRKLSRKYRKQNEIDSASPDSYTSHGHETTSMSGYQSRSRSSTCDSCGSCSSESESSSHSKTRSKRYYKKSCKRRQMDSRSCSTASSEYERDESYSRGNSSRSRSRSHSRTRSRSPYYRHNRASHYKETHSNSNNNNNYYVDRNYFQPAVEERRIVYVGRIEAETTKEMLKRKFSQYGVIKNVSIHYKETGLKYGFITYQHSEDAFAAIDNGPRNSQFNMYDISFGGRRAFCRSSYADLDNAGRNNYQSYVYPSVVSGPKKEESFEDLLLKMKEKINANKTVNANASKI